MPRSVKCTQSVLETKYRMMLVRCQTVIQEAHDALKESEEFKGRRWVEAMPATLTDTRKTLDTFAEADLEVAE